MCEIVAFSAKENMVFISAKKYIIIFPQSHFPNQYLQKRLYFKGIVEIFEKRFCKFLSK